MPLTYTWKINTLRKINVGEFSDYVCHIEWSKTGIDENGNTGTFSGSMQFNPSETGTSSLTPFNELTESTVIGWVQAACAGDYENEINFRIQKQIEEKSAQMVSDGNFPWNTAP